MSRSVLHFLAPTWRAEQSWRRLGHHLATVATLVAAMALWFVACWAATL